MKKCVECEKELVNRQRKYCSIRCKDKYKYHNNEEHRLRTIDRAKKRVYEKRELERVKKESDLIKQMLIDIRKEKTDVEMNIEALYNLINNK